MSEIFGAIELAALVTPVIGKKTLFFTEANEIVFELKIGQILGRNIC